MNNFKVIFKFLMITSIAFLIFSFSSISHERMSTMDHSIHNKSTNTKSVEYGCLVSFEGKRVCINDLILYIKNFLITNSDISVFIITVYGLLFFNKKEIFNFYKKIKLLRRFLYQKLLFYFEKSKNIPLYYLNVLFKTGILNPKVF